MIDNFSSEPPMIDLTNENEFYIPKIDCNYYSPSDFKTTILNYTDKSFSMLSMNIRSCRTNFSEFVGFLSEIGHKFSIIVLVEIWLIKDCDYSFDITGYKCCSIYKSNIAGGIKIYYDNRLNIEILNQLTIVDDTMQVLTLNLKGLNFKYTICAVYKPPSSNPYIFNDMFFNFIVDNFPRNSKVILTGDFNLNLLNPLSLNYIEEFMSYMLSYGYFPMINRPAKINEENPITKYSLIDQIWVNFLDSQNFNSGIILYKLTDHFPIYYSFKNNSIKSCKSITYRLITENSTRSFLSHIERSNLNSILNIHDPNDAYQRLNQKLFECYDECFPVKTKRIKSNPINAPWITLTLKKCIKKKYTIYNLYKRGLIGKGQFLWYKNLLGWVVSKMRRLYQINKFINCEKNGRKLWSNINSLLHRKEKEQINQLTLENGQIVKGQNMAYYFNEYFTGIASILVNDLPTQINYDYLNSHIHFVPQSCFLAPTDENEIHNILKYIPNKGNQLHDIKPNLLNSIASEFCPVAAHVYNTCLIKGVYPDMPKIARTIPIYKSGDPEVPNNYRPISNLSTVNKVFEILTYNRLNDFIEKYGILSEMQYGFRKGKSTTLAILDLTNDFLDTFNKKSFTIALFLDLRKAFDTVDKYILIHKLSILGFRGVSNDFLDSYLSNRKQFVDLNGHTSGLLNVVLGLPQGSNLGPLLFNVFINDITYIIEGKKILFADDGVFYVTANTFEECIGKIIKLITELSEYLKNNRLIPNTEKTKLMLITPRPTDDLPDIYFNGTKLDWVSSIRYLGIILDNKLNFIQNSIEVHRRISSLHGVFYSLATQVPQKTLKTLFNALVFPVYSQNIIIWGGISENNLIKIKSKINGILRIILNVKYDENNIPVMHVNDMYKELNILKFDDNYKFHLVKFLHYSMYRNGSIFTKYFAPHLPDHSYNTRNRIINLPGIRLNIERNFTIFQCCKLLNELSDTLIEPQSNTMLRNRFREKCFLEY